MKTLSVCAVRRDTLEDLPLKYIIVTIIACIAITLLYNRYQRRRLKEEYNKKRKQLQEDYLASRDKLKKDVATLENEKSNFEEYRQKELQAIKEQRDSIEHENMLRAEAAKKRIAELEEENANLLANIIGAEQKLTDEQRLTADRSDLLAKQMKQANKIIAEYNNYVAHYRESQKQVDDKYASVVSLHYDVQQEASRLKQDLAFRYQHLNESSESFYKTRDDFASGVIRKSVLYDYLCNSLTYTQIASHNYLGYNRLYNYIYEETHHIYHDIISISVEAKIKGKNGEQYTTTLDSCTCPDFKNNLGKAEPCKHMYMLAYELALLNELPLEKIKTTLQTEVERLTDARKKNTKRK